jgi:hypothetical protein
LCGASGGHNTVKLNYSLIIEVKNLAKIASPQAFIGE